MEKNLKIQVTQSDDLIVKVNRRCIVLLLIKHHKDFKNDDTIYWKIMDGIFVIYIYIYIYPTKRQMYTHLPPISKSIQIRRKIHVKHCSRIKD